MARSPSVAKPGDTMPRNGPVEAHAADVDREQGGDEAEDPAAVDRRPGRLLLGQPAGKGQHLGVLREEQVGDGRVAGSPAVNTGDRKMFKAVPKILAAPAAATVHAPIACPRRTSSAPQTRRLPSPARIQARAERRVSLR